jgi:hypothetical protein
MKPPQSPPEGGRNDGDYVIDLVLYFFVPTNCFSI